MEAQQAALPTLDSCRSCGGKAEVCSFKWQLGATRWFVRCHGCNASTANSHGSAAEAIAAWNAGTVWSGA